MLAVLLFLLLMEISPDVFPNIDPAPILSVSQPKMELSKDYLFNGVLLV